MKAETGIDWDGAASSAGPAGCVSGKVDIGGLNKSDLVHQFEHRSARCHLAKRIERGALRDRIEALNLGRVAFEKFLEHGRAVLDRYFADLEIELVRALPEADGAGGARIANPSGLPAHGDEVAMPIHLEEVDGSSIRPPAFAPPRFKQIVVRRPDSEADQKPEEPVKHPVGRTFFEKKGLVAVHRAHPCHPERDREHTGVRKSSPCEPWIDWRGRGREAHARVGPYRVGMRAAGCS